MRLAPRIGEFETKSRMRIPRLPKRLLVFGLNIAAFALCGASASHAAGPSDPATMAVSVVKAKSACFVDSLQLSGYVVARDEVLVRPDVEGLQVAQSSSRTAQRSG